MAKTVVKFLRTHGSYIKGDFAGFAAHVAQNFADAKPPIAKIMGEAKTVSPQSDAGLKEQYAALAQRSEALDQKEVELAERAAALKAAEDAAGAAAGAGAGAGAGGGKAAKAAGTPPAQGAKAT